MDKPVELTEEQKLAKAEATQAPPVNSPSYVDNSVAQVREDQTKSRESLAEAESKLLAEGSQTPFWELLKKRMLNTIDVMRRAEATRMGQGNLDLTSIGLRSIIINEVADALEGIVKTVEVAERKQIVSNNSDAEDVTDTLGLEEIEKQG